MSRPNLNELSEEARALLVSLIERYTTPQVVNTHWRAALAGVHTNPTEFLIFHRQFLSGLEDFLREQGELQFVPLPAWNPAEPIPREFNIPSTGIMRLRKLNPQISFSPEFDSENLSRFSTLAELGEALMRRHNLVHRTVGGIMNNVRLSPIAPIFWPFHAFIDDIWSKWEEIFK